MKYFKYAAPLPLLLLAACGAPPDTAQKPGELTGQEQHLLSVADSTRQSGNLDGAAELYRELAAESHGEVAGHLGLASIYRQQHKPDEAVFVLRGAQKLQPHNPQVLVALGSALVATDQAGEALGIFDQALAVDAKDLGALNGKGVALDSLGEHEKAQDIYHEALAIAPDNVATQNNLALSLVLAGHYNDAISILEKLAATPSAQSATIRQNLALAYGLKGNRKKALELGLRDLSTKDAQENLRFYEYYQGLKKSGEPTYKAVPVAPVHAQRLAPGEKSDAEKAKESADRQEDKAIGPEAEKAKMQKPVAVKKPLEAGPGVMPAAPPEKMPVDDAAPDAANAPIDVKPLVPTVTPADKPASATVDKPEADEPENSEDTPDLPPDLPDQEKL